jgi:hypothetical protein
MSTNWLNPMKTKQTLHTELTAKFNKPIIGIKEMSELLDIPKRTLQQNIYTGRFEVPTFSLGRTRMVRLSDLADYIDAQCTASAAEIAELN